MNKKKIRANMYVKESLYKKLKRILKKEGITVTAWLEKKMSEYIK